MTGPDTSRLAAGDVTAALRSFPRRFREALAASPDEDPEELARRSGPDGISAVDALVDTISTLAVLERGISEIVNSQSPLLHPSVTDPSQRQWEPPPGLDLATLTEMLTDQATDLANLTERIASTDWDRTAKVADGPTVSALELAREAARVGAVNLRSATDAMAAAQRG